MVVVVSHLFLFLGDKFRGRCDSHESHLPLCGTIYFPTAPSLPDPYLLPRIDQIRIRNPVDLCQVLIRGAVL